jgi:NADPH2 dehydrogenase
MKLDDPVPQFSYIVEQLRARQPDLAYLHLTEPRIAGGSDRESSAAESNDFLKKIWSPLPIITAGGYTRESAIKHSEENANELVAFGRLFISNVRTFPITMILADWLTCANISLTW